MLLRKRFCFPVGVSVCVIAIVKLLADILQPHVMTGRSKHAPAAELPVDCLESNICRMAIQDGVVIYSYTRHYDFYHQLNQRVNYNVNITNDHDVVPRIVHLVWVNEKGVEFQFFQLLTMMAIQRHVQPLRIYFWHNNLPQGHYWRQAIATINNLYFVYRKRVTQIYGRKILRGIHVSDIIRMEALMEYGGMYFDFDSVVVNPVDPLLKYDVVMGHEEWYILANGMMFCKPWSDFFRVWYPRYATFNNDFQTHSNIIPNIISLRRPNLIHIEEVSLCKPNYKTRQYLFEEGMLWDWRRDNYVIHLYILAYTHAGYEAMTPENIKYMNTTIGEVTRYIYYGDSKLWGVRPLPMRKTSSP
ncbi:uncharacterized protein LOC124257033 [Haliotis rubra]|uniref:uncharacterized protein LOC124257033 n=1 Tax=Haliotis rubra TaxID=36100 RepID=UPI001EE4EED4|nr:uncharacterized protein LOC124257033 [Haliotis rubra]